MTTFFSQPSQLVQKMLGTQELGCSMESHRGPAYMGNSHELCPFQVNTAPPLKVCSRFIFIWPHLTDPGACFLSPNSVFSYKLICMQLLGVKFHFFHPHSRPPFPSWLTGQETRQSSGASAVLGRDL